jgi:hypothetical protein
MDYKDAIAIFENNTKRSVVQIERCSVGIAALLGVVKMVLKNGSETQHYI